jgi:hypothetical protein
MQIPAHKLQQIRNLLYNDRPSYTKGMLDNDEIFARLLNEVLNALFPNRSVIEFPSVTKSNADILDYIAQKWCV